MSITDWRPSVFPIEEEIRGILRKKGLARATTEDCKAWARTFIRQCIPDWVPGASLSVREAQVVGRAFEAAACRANPHAFEARARTARRWK